MWWLIVFISCWMMSWICLIFCVRLSVGVSSSCSVRGVMRWWWWLGLVFVVVGV